MAGTAYLGQVALFFINWASPTLRSAERILMIQTELGLREPSVVLHMPWQPRRGASHAEAEHSVCVLTAKCNIDSHPFSLRVGPAKSIPRVRLLNRMVMQFFRG